MVFKNWDYPVIFIIDGKHNNSLKVSREKQLKRRRVFFVAKKM